MIDAELGPGFAALWTSSDQAAPDLHAAVDRVIGGRFRDSCGPVQVSSWGGAELSAGSTVALTREARLRDESVSPARVARMLRGDRPSSDLCWMLPSFGAVSRDWAGSVTACTDALGFLQLYTRSGCGWAAVSTSARVLAALGGSAPDEQALAVQSLLGWQLGDRTLFRDVVKLGAGNAVTVSRTGLRIERYDADGEPGRLTADQAVPEMRDLLRRYLAAYLDDHPDSILQLTGGQDSRLLLSAIAPSRRQSVRAMTLGVPGSADVEIAAVLAARFGMEHEIIDLAGLDELPPHAAAGLVAAAAGRLEASADPVARAGLDFAERASRPGPRISGLGGEVARGFYYFGPKAGGPVTMARARRLARWRMFTNDAVDPSALDPRFATWADDIAVRAVHSALVSTGRPWFAATDALYLDHRMQRWGGATESAVAGTRRIANPMLDDRFVATACALSPQEKRHGRFLAQLQVALDEELASLPMDGRPAPRVYASSYRSRSTARARTTGDKVVRKVRQRISGSRRPPAGGAVLADLLARHWRTDPSALEAIAADGIFRTAWLDRVASGEQQVTPATAALIVNLDVVKQATRGEAHLPA